MQLENHGIRLVEGDDANVTWVDCSPGAPKLKSRMKFLRQLGLVKRMGSKLIG
jgi:hypothetical protein